MGVKVDIFSGFLGAGKTMLIKKLLSEKLYKENVVIIENEFGEIGIDGTLLKRSNIEVKEINAGCICCTVVGDFKKAIDEVINKYRPDRIIIEPSGVGKLSEVLKACRSYSKNQIKLNMIITVVDALKYSIYIENFDEFYKNQIQNAKTIVLSRTQMLNSTKLEEIRNEIAKINKEANIITTPWDKVNGKRIMEVGEKDIRKAFHSEVKSLIKKPHKFIVYNKANIQAYNNTMHNANDTFEVWGSETAKIYSKNEINNIFNKIDENNDLGTVLRGKGIIETKDKKWVQFDYVPGELSVRECDPDYSGRLCIIGSKLNVEKIKELFTTS